MSHNAIVQGIKCSSSLNFFVYHGWGMHICRHSPQKCEGPKTMSLDGQRVSGVKVLNIMEESDAAVEKMANRAIDELNAQNIKILDIKITGDNLILILGDKESAK